MKGSKKTLLTVLAVVLVAAVAGVLCIGLRAAPAVSHGVRISELLQPVLTAENQTVHIAVSAGIGGDSLELESDLFLVTEDGTAYLAVHRNETAVYVADNVLFLENGKAFRIGEKLQFQSFSYEGLLPQIGALYEVLKITAAETEEETAYSVTVTGEQAAALLAAASLGEALPVEGIEKLELSLTEKNGKLDRISFSGNGKLEGTSAAVQVTLSGFRILAPGDYPIPEAVKQSAASVDPEELFSLTEDLYRLLLALVPLADSDAISGHLKLTVDCGLLQLDTGMPLSDLKTAADGRLDPEKLQALPEMLGWLFLEGQISCSREGGAYLYELALDQSAMKELSRMILPELTQYGADLTEGKVSIMLDADKITSMGVAIEGKIDALIARIPVTVGAEFTFD